MARATVLAARSPPTPTSSPSRSRRRRPSPASPKRIPPRRHTPVEGT